jgi:dolichol-phosphate mannosyltransferase
MPPGRLVPRPDPGLLSLVIPVYNEEAVLPLLRPRLEALIQAIPCPVEVIFVDDGSRDATAPMVRAWAERDSRIRLLEFARNFGHQAAVTAGVDHAGGEAVVVMDLQDPPELVLDMLARYREGYDVVYAQRTQRHGETAFKLATARLFYWIMRTFVHRDLPPATGDFRLMSRPVVDALGALREGQRFLRGMVTWLGYNQVALPFERPARAAGETKYPLRKMLAFAWDAILSFSSAPLRLAMYVGVLAVLFGFGVAGYSVVRWLEHRTVPGWTTIVVLQALIGGATLMCLGMIGEYVGRIYDEVKARPIYIIRRWTNGPAPRQAARAVIPGRDTP